MSDTTAGLLQVGALIAALALCWKPLGDYMARVFTSERDLRVERALYRVVGVDARSDQRWSVYAGAVLAFSLVSVVGLYVLQRVQGSLPLSLGFPGSTRRWRSTPLRRSSRTPTGRRTPARSP